MKFYQKLLFLSCITLTIQPVSQNQQPASISMKTIDPNTGLLTATVVTYEVTQKKEQEPKCIKYAKKELAEQERLKKVKALEKSNFLSRPAKK